MLHRLNQHVFDLFLPRARPACEVDRLIAAAGVSHVAARRALASAVAEEEREAARRDALIDRAADLEGRALEALAAGRDDLAMRAAEAIAVLETEVSASEAGARRFAGKVATARREVDAQRRRLADLDRGRRLAKVGSALARSEGVPLIARAEAALLALQAGQADDEAVAREFAPAAETLADDLAEAGFGRPTRTLPNEVLARLRARIDNAALTRRHA